jgi:hypothetical protein
MPKITAEFFIDVRSHPKSPDLEYFSVAKGQGMGLNVVDEGPDKILRSATTRANEYPVASPNLAEYFLLGRKLIRMFQLHFIYYSSARIFLMHVSCSSGYSCQGFIEPNEVLVEN